MTELHTGGQLGADDEFLHCAQGVRHTVLVYNVLHLFESRTIIQKSDAAFKTAGIDLMRSTNISSYLKYIYYRRVQIAQNVSSIYAVSDWEEGKTTRNVGIADDTAWTCQVFANEHDGLIQLYFLSQSECAWYQLEKTNAVFIWRPIERPPKPVGKYAGIGVRDLTPFGRSAIQSLYL